MDVKRYWAAVLEQNADAMREYFHVEGYVRWHATNEHFTVEEFIQANCEYPGEWDGEVERIEEVGDLIITAVHVYTRSRSLSFHVVSFIRLKEDKILSVDEYWGDDGIAPKWRLNKQIGCSIV